MIIFKFTYHHYPHISGASCLHRGVPHHQHHLQRASGQKERVPRGDGRELQTGNDVINVSRD